MELHRVKADHLGDLGYLVGRSVTEDPHRQWQAGAPGAARRHGPPRQPFRSLGDEPASPGRRQPPRARGEHEPERPCAQFGGEHHVVDPGQPTDLDDRTRWEPICRRRRYDRVLFQV